MHHALTTAAFALLIAASANAQPTDAKQLKDQITGDAKGSASANPQCRLFTQAEIAGYVGAPVGPAENAAGGAGCNWHDQGYQAWATVSVVAAKDFPRPTLLKGFKPLPDVGSKGWVAPDSGWSAGALVDEMAIVVVVSGKTATEAAVVSLLRDAIKRRKTAGQT